MALSFEDKSKTIGAVSTTSLLSTAAVTGEENQIAAYSEETFTRSDKYLWYEKYHDDKLSTISENKDITVDSSQINLTQETNSQYIPFQMNRYYDGIDLMEMSLLIHYVNKNGDEDFAVPVNVSYSEDKIHFAWLVSKTATAIAGDVQFELQANGVNEKGDEYIWKSKPNGKINILKSLAGNGVIEPDQEWVTQFMTQMTEKVAQAQAAAQEAQAAITTVEQYATNAATSAIEAQTVVDTAKSELESTVQETITTALEDYYTKEEVDTLLEEIDLTEVYDKIDSIDGLAAFDAKLSEDGKTITFYNGETAITSLTINTDPSAEWVESYNLTVDQKISDAVTPVQNSLSEYITTNNAAVKALDEKIGDLPTTLQTDYYTKTETDNLLKDKATTTEVANVKTEASAASSAASSNTTKIGELGNKLAELEEAMNSESNKNAGYTYEATYSEDYTFTLWEIENEGDSENEVRTAKNQFKIQGGSGSGGTSSTLAITYITKTPLIVTSDGTALLEYTFTGTDSSGDDVGDGTATWKVNGSVVATETIPTGNNSFDITKYLAIGSQKVVLSITDANGSLATKTWTVQKIDVRLESSFNDQLTYPIGDVSFDYTPYGAISKVVHFEMYNPNYDSTKLDSVEWEEIGTVTTSASGIPMAYTIPARGHGSHLVRAYMTANVNNTTITSNTIYKDIIWYNAASELPVIGCTQVNITAKQYDTTSIVYTVYDPHTETPTVSLAVDGVEVSEETMTSSTATWLYKSSDVGTHTLTITCRDVVKTITVVIEKLDINVTPVTGNLAFDFNPVGYSNNSANRLWTNGTVSMTVSDNFDWTNGGYQIDENGDQYFSIKAGTNATFDYQLFADDARKNGKEFKIIFKTSKVRNTSAKWLTCMSDGIGVEMSVHDTTIYSSAGSLYSPYSEEDIIEFDFNIFKDTDIPIVLTYEDGTPYRPMEYDSTHSFTQTTPAYITIGSEDCDVAIYRMKAYSASLTSSGILSNFIADARNAEEMISRYNHNQIYDENGLLNPDVLAEKCPQLHVLKIECPRWTTDKSDFVKDTAVQMIYKNGDPTLDNWKAINCYHSGQGTTSNEYGLAGRNFNVLMCFDGTYTNKKITDCDYSTYKTQITYGDNSVISDGTGKVTLTRNSVPANILNIKVNIASSENENNALLQKRFNDYLPYRSVANQNDSRVKNTMEFVNCVVFIKETDPVLANHSEFQDNEWHFYTIGNVGDSKDTDITRVNDPTDHNEFVVEIADNTFPNSVFPTGVTDEDGNIVYPIAESQWVAGNTAYDTLHNSWGETYEFRYEHPDITDEENAANTQIWNDFYKWVVTSSDEDFVAQLGDWFIIDSALYFYLFTERYTMIDNRAKNTFWHYAKCEDGVYRFEFWGYDHDSALGINNSGEMTMPYGKEDIDYRTDGDPSSGYIFNAATSVFFRRIRNLMYDELSTLFVSLESAGCWSSSGLISEFDERQSEFPEELWRLDYERKYERTYRAGTPRFLKTMMNGRKKYHRRQFERDQEKYMATKYFGNVATSDQIMFRCNTPIGAMVTPDYTLHLIPYSDMYLSVMFGATYRTQIRAKAGKSYDIECPYSTMDDTAVLIYCASRIQAIGDLSACYIHDNDFSKATKMQSMTVGNNTEGYSNGFLTNLNMGNNELLRYLDIRNTPNLSAPLDLSKCGELRELYAEGSGLTGITFADGGRIETAHLPETITALTMKNLMYLTDLDIASYDSIIKLVIENCNTFDTLKMVENSPKLYRVRMIGINWNDDNYADTEESEVFETLDRVYDMYGVDSLGYDSTQSVLAGTAHAHVMYEQSYNNFTDAWHDLAITYNSFVQQFPVTFINDDGTVLDIQYVEMGKQPVDPIIRAENPIATPTKESSASHDYTYAGWDSAFVNVFEPLVYTATYTESLRKYTIKYVSKSIVLQETEAEYGTNVFYEGEIPTYTSEEASYRFYLFSGWNQSGLVTGDKTIEALYDSCSYTNTYFDGKDLSELTPVEIYMMLKMGVEANYVEEKDTVAISLGSDVSYSDIQEDEIISQTTEFTGSNYLDTGVALFEEDRDFTLAIDYEFASDAANNGVLMQCYQSDGSNGFKLWNSSYPRLTWGTTSTTCSGLGKRDIIVLRHIKGEKVLHVYCGNLPATTINYSELASTRLPETTQTLVLGCSRADDGMYENYAKGTVYWCKLWYTDLGDATCKDLVSWTHENVTLYYYGARRYYLSDGSGKRSQMSFIAAHLLENAMAINTNISNNTGGWAASTLNTFLNDRFYNAINHQWKTLLKQVKITSTIGGGSSETSESNCYIAIPSVTEISGGSSFQYEPYTFEGSSIPIITSDSDRIRTFVDGVANDYWTRSPAVGDYESNYFYYIGTDGQPTTWSTSQNTKGICIILSM